MLCHFYPQITRKLSTWIIPRPERSGYTPPTLSTNFLGKPPQLCYNPAIAPVAQLDRVLVSEAKGRGFDSRRARQLQKQSQDSAH
jgi:hypothetical protein